MIQGTCAVESCERRATAHGWCSMHHHRWVRHGDPLMVTRLRGSLAADKLAAYTRRVEGGCLIWQAQCYVDGYGRVYVQGKARRTHRVAWELAYGPIPDGLLVCHRCDNPPCCEPTHLFLGTDADNAQDKMLKGRAVMGCGTGGRCSIDWSTAGAIRAAVDSGERNVDVAARFGVSPAVVANIKCRKTWDPARRLV